MRINNIITVFFSISSSVSFITCILKYNNFSIGYQSTIILPISFIVIYFIFYKKIMNKSKTPFTLYGILFMQWIRFVIIPPICSISGSESGFHYINPTTNSLYLSSFFMLYEFIFISIGYIIITKKDKTVKTKKILLMGNKFIYLIFIFMAMVLYITIGKQYKLLGFLIIPVDGGERVGDVTSTLFVLVRQIITCAVFIMFIWILSSCRKKYEYKKNSKYVNIAIIIALVNVGIIIGERRTAQIYTAIISIFILSKVFPKHKKRAFLCIFSLACIVLLFMSIYKFFGAFLYDSYAEAIKNSNLDMPWIARTLQSYFFGPENIAITLDFANVHNFNIFEMIFDFIRSTFGPSFLVKNLGVLTSARFNTFVYGIPMETGHVLSSIGYGYIYLGIILSPVIAMLNIWICKKVELILYNAKSYEMSYIWAYVLVRFSTNLFVNTPPLISLSSIMLGTCGLLCIVSILLSKRNINNDVLIK